MLALFVRRDATLKMLSIMRLWQRRTTIIYLQNVVAARVLVILSINEKQLYNFIKEGTRAQMLEMRCPSVFSQNFPLKPVFFLFHEFQDSFILILIQPEAYASVSGSAISGGTASEYGVEQISNMSRFGRLP